MTVFVTGASGWIGSAAVDALLARGQQVIGLARSDASVAALTAKGVTVQRGDLDDLDSLRAGAEAADAVVHLANKHDWSDAAESNRAERAAVQTFVDVLTGSGKPFLLASGVAGLGHVPAVETDRTDARGLQAPRGGTENLALDATEAGLHAVSLRFAPTVHGAGDHGFVPVIVGEARRRGASGSVGDGANRWAAVHRTDAGEAVALAVEKAGPGTVLHVVAEEGIATRAIAEAIGRGLDVPVDSVAAEDLGWIGRFFALEMSARSDATRELLGWTPSGPTLLEDLAGPAYFA